MRTMQVIALLVAVFGVGTFVYDPWGWFDLVSLAMIVNGAVSTYQYQRRIAAKKRNVSTGVVAVD